MNLSDIVKFLDQTPTPKQKEKTTADRFQDALFGMIQRDHCTKTRPKVWTQPDQKLYLRCSELPKFVERPQKIVALQRLSDLTVAPAKNEIGEQLNFDVGHAVHGWWQNEYLARLTDQFALWGYWRCVCGLGGSAKGVIEKKPTLCRCGLGVGMTYEEVTVYDHRLRLTGHPDALLGETAPQFIGEIKTIGSDRWEKLRGPTLEHQVQVHAYMFATGLREAIYCYVDKGKQSLWRRTPAGEFEIYGEPRIKVFHQKFDPVLGKRIEDTLTLFWAAVGKLAP